MDEMQEMLEHYRITKLVKEYCHGCDRGDGVRMASVYARQSWDDHGNIKLDGKEFAAEIMRIRRSRPGAMSHQLGQTQVHIDGDVAGAETYFVATVCYAGPEGEPYIDQLGGRYVDSLVREGGRWRITERLTLRDWSITHAVTRDFIGTLGFIEGSTNSTDPSFRVLRLEHSGGFGSDSIVPAVRQPVRPSTQD